MELGAVLEERHAIGVGLDAGGLIPGRPHRAALDVAQEDVRPPVIARDVLAPARDREAARTGCSPSPPPSASPRSARWRADASAGVGSWGDVNWRKTGATKSRAWAGASHLLDPRAGDRDVPRARAPAGAARWPGRWARAWNRARMRAVAEHVRQRDEGHPLMVRHVGAHDRHRRALGEPRPRVVERLVEAVRSAGSHRRRGAAGCRAAAAGSIIAASAVA